MLFLLAMTSALAVGAVFVTRLFVASVRANELSTQVEPAAERAALDALTGWDTLARPLQPIGGVDWLGQTSDGATTSNAWITRVGPRVYWLVVETRNGSRPALRRRIGALIRVTDKVGALVSARAWSELP